MLLVRVSRQEKKSYSDGEPGYRLQSRSALRASVGSLETEENMFRGKPGAWGLTGIALVAMGCSGSPGESAEAMGTVPAPGEPTLEEVRAATERFRDVEVALAEGFIRDPEDMCITAAMEGYPPEEGAMGVHYFRPDLLQLSGPPDPLVSGSGTHTDFTLPAVLIYEPQADGSLELVAVENLAFADAWERAGHRDPPSFHGVPYDYMANDPTTDLDEGHGFMPHYDRHVWLYRENPRGIFHPMNPNVSCAHHPGHMH
jgi:hypothetical protein